MRSIDLRLRFADIGFRLVSEVPLTFNDELSPFLDASCCAPDCTVTFCLREVPPVFSDARILRSEMGREYGVLPNGDFLCRTSTAGQFWGVARCRPDFSQVELFASPKNPHLTSLYIFSYLPIRHIFRNFGVLILHAAQIAPQNRGVLFTAASGTGKTTQTRLWLQYRNVRPVCNDRTLLRKTPDGWRTYGFPFDGGDPVRSGEILPLACLVALAQGRENLVERLAPAKAASFLIEQAVFDVSSADARASALDMLLRLIEDIPVYFLRCTADERAVTCLERRLIQDGVLPDG